MFCEDCGYENETHAKYCIGCGKKIEPKQPPITVVKNIVKREFPFQPNPLIIFIGIAVIVSLYIFPIHHLINYRTGITTTLSTEQMVVACNAPGTVCPFYLGIGFYLLWMLGLGLIIFGIFQKKIPKKISP
jgi:hypothetical protein